jgi:two-component system, OmpR family, response regulator MprA
VLVVEDDKAVRESVERALRLEGYLVDSVADGLAALEAAPARQPDVIVLDVMLPFVDGLTVCRRLRDGGDRTPILVLTARAEISDRVAGLDAGADDYLPKPFALEELLARLRALLRRVSTEEPSVLVVDDLRIDELARRAWRGSRELELTKTEFDLLVLLARNSGVVLDHTTIYERIWGYDFETSSRSLDVYIGYLRTKTEAGGEPRLVHTVRGVGYLIRKP